MNNSGNSALSFSSSTYKNHIFEGFSRLQQSDEFVDMTLAAEGHFVKVHRTLVALASPYFRELLRSMPCQHPIIYLFDVSHEALGFILEYLYTGQVEIPAEKVQSFLNIAKDMHIAGLTNVVPPDENERPTQVNQSKHVFHNTKQQPPVATRSNYENTNFQQHVPSFMIPEAGNENDNSSFLINTPIFLEGVNSFLNTSNVQTPGIMINKHLNEPATIINDLNPKHNELQNITNTTGKMINITLDATNDDYSSQNLKSNELRNIRRIKAPKKMINVTFAETAATSNNTNQELGSNDLPSSRNVSQSGKIINITMNDTAETNDDINQMPINNELESISNLNEPENTIDLTLDEYSRSASNDNIRQKPVAKIEILSNTLINSNNNPGINLTRHGQLPQLYAQALANINNQSTSINPGTSKPIVKSASSANRSLSDISQLLEFRDHEPMDEDNTSYALETQAQSQDVEEINAMVYTDNTEEADMVDQDKDTDTILYTSSNRGAVQLIMNRFMYYCHYQLENGRKRRWRCIDYRDSQCQAMVDTVGEEIVARKWKHCHPNHEKKIRKKKSKIFPTMKMALTATNEKKPAKCVSDHAQ